MSHQSILIDSFAHSAKRFSQTAKQGIDVLGTVRHKTLIAPAFPIKRQQSAEGTVGFSKEILMKFPTSGYVQHVAVKFSFAAKTTNDYTDYIAMSCIDEIEFRSGNLVLQQFKYAPAMEYYFSKLKDEETIDKLLLAAGGTTQGSAGTYIAIIPLFFDSILSPGARPLNLSKFKKTPELIVKTRTLAKCLRGGSTDATSAIETADILLWMVDTTSTLKNMHKAAKNDFHHGIDFSTQINNIVATATDTYVDISGIKGNTQKLHVTARLVSDETGTNNKYFLGAAEIGEIITYLDGSEQHVFKHKEEAEIDYIFYNNGKGASSTLGYGNHIPYSYTGEIENNVHVGGLHDRQVSKNQIRITHALGANAYVHVTGIRSAIFKYEDGGMEKLL